MSDERSNKNDRLNPPLGILQIGAATIARLSRCSYETPCFTAEVEVIDPGRWARLCEATAFLDWIEALPGDVTDAEFEAELRRRELSDADVRLDRGGLQLVDAAGAARTIYDPRCEAHSITWRW